MMLRILGTTKEKIILTNLEIPIKISRRIVASKKMMVLKVEIISVVVNLIKSLTAEIKVDQEVTLA